MAVNEHLSASQEDYLEAIFWIASSKGAARTKDIAKRLRVKAASVTRALQVLAKRKYVNYAPYEVVTLTSEGIKEARKVIRNHETLRDFFVRVLGIKKKTADEEACRLEHNITKPIVDRLIEFMTFVETCPLGGRDWIEKFIGQCILKKNKNCEACIVQYLKDFNEKKSMTQANQEITLANLPFGAGI